MGLDAYIYVKGVSNTDKVLDDSIDNTMENGIEIWYGRKEHEFHQWMHQLFHRKGGDPNLQFNCESYVLLDDLDMDDLIEDLQSDQFKDLDIGMIPAYKDLAYTVKRLIMTMTKFYLAQNEVHHY